MHRKRKDKVLSTKNMSLLNNITPEKPQNRLKKKSPVIKMLLKHTLQSLSLMDPLVFEKETAPLAKAKQFQGQRLAKPSW